MVVVRGEQQAKVAGAAARPQGQRTVGGLTGCCVQVRGAARQDARDPRGGCAAAWAKGSGSGEAVLVGVRR